MSETKTPDAGLEALLEYLRYSRGFDFSGYKRPSLSRRIQRRMQQVGIADFDSYRDYLEVHQDEFAHLFDTLLINVTSFFRDQPAWEFLQQEVIPAMVAERTPQAAIRAWSAGCANGAEAYTLAMVLAEVLGEEGFLARAKIYATDIDEAALMYGRQGIYTESEVEPIPRRLLEKYFVPTNERWAFRNDLRRAVIFGRHDLLQDAPISHLDLLVCRNTLMYFNAEAQARVLLRFHYALNEGGVLFLGRAEMMLAHANLFRPIELKHRIFERLPRATPAERLLPVVPGGPAQAAPVTPRMRVVQNALDRLPMALLVLDVTGKLVFFNKQAEALFALRADDLEAPIQDLEISYRPAELRSLIEQAYHERKAVVVKDIVYRRAEAESAFLQLQVTPLFENGERLGVSIAYLDDTRAHELQAELNRVSQELTTAYEELQSTNEELETTNEELQSTNEELETTNEELQSTNEELETLNEELQSTNEELQTTNDEMQVRTEELNRSNTFLQSILASLSSAVVVLDSQCNILVWNKWAEEMWGLRAEETTGKSLPTLDIGLPVEKLMPAIRACLASQEESVLEVEATNRRGRAVTVGVDISALRNEKGETRGVILVMEERKSNAGAHA